MLNKKSVDDINVKGKRVLVRCDFNVPLIDGKITDENRLVAALPTIKKLINDGGKVILCSHLGKPKNGPSPEFSLAPVAVRLTELLGQEVKLLLNYFSQIIALCCKGAVNGAGETTKFPIGENKTHTQPRQPTANQGVNHPRKCRGVTHAV